MANDREVLREIWQGKVPVCFSLDPEDVYNLQAPDPFYLMVPRLSYFPLCTDKVSKFKFIIKICCYFYENVVYAVMIMYRLENTLCAM